MKKIKDSNKKEIKGHFHSKRQHTITRMNDNINTNTTVN